MSTKARKERKRNGFKFVKPAKVGTPVVERAANQPRLMGHGDHKRFGLPKTVIRRLRDRGIDAA